jgi:hypothetical protein
MLILLISSTLSIFNQPVFPVFQFENRHNLIFTRRFFETMGEKLSSLAIQIAALFEISNFKFVKSRASQFRKNI